MNSMQQVHDEAIHDLLDHREPTVRPSKWETGEEPDAAYDTHGPLHGQLPSVDLAEAA